MIYILFFFALFAGFTIYSSRFSNPYKLIFLFGKKGTGKSTYMVKLMLQHLRRGWHVYTNMADVNIPGVRLFDVAGLTSCTPEPKSVLFIDEAGLIWDSRNFKSFDKGYTEFFKLQRKYHCKVVINSQSFDVDKKLRDLTDSMYLQTNIGNVIGISRPIVRKITLVEATGTSDSRIADNLRFDTIFRWQFTWLPRYFKYFDSFDAPAREPLTFTSVSRDLAQALAGAQKWRRWRPARHFLKSLSSRYK